MPKLYYSDTSCGAANFISAHTAGVNMQCEQVDLMTHKTTGGVDFYSINKRGNVPTIVLDDGVVINQNAATLPWIAAQKPGTVAPEPGTSAYYECLALLAWTASELHPALGKFFTPPLEGPIVEERTAILKGKLSYLNDTLLAGGKKFLVGDKFTVADSYTAICLSWMAAPFPGQAKGLAAMLEAYPAAKAYYEGIMKLPNVTAAQARMATKPSTIL